MKRLKVFMLLAVVFACVTVCESPIFAADEEIYSDKIEDVSVCENIFGETDCEEQEKIEEILERESSIENETLCTLRKSNGRRNLAKSGSSEASVLLHTVFYDEINGEYNKELPLSVYVCTGEKRRE